MKKRSQISSEKEKLSTGKNKKGAGDMSGSVFCLVVGPYSVFWKSEHGLGFLNRGRIKKFLNHICIILN